MGGYMETVYNLLRFSVNLILFFKKDKIHFFKKNYY